MLSAYSVLMMLLIVTGSLIGVSIIYTPANVETQPQPQIPGSKIIVPDAQLTIAQQQQDKRLLDRLMPEIIKRIDVKLVLTQRPGQTGEMKAGFLSGGGAAWGKAGCPPGETAVSAGFTHRLNSGTEQSIFNLRKDDPNSNAFDITTSLDGSGKLFTYAECLKVQLSLRPVSAQQPGSLAYLQEIPQPPAKPQPPSQPPGGPPLQPPPEFGRK